MFDVHACHIKEGGGGGKTLREEEEVVVAAVDGGLFSILNRAGAIPKFEVGRTHWGEGGRDCGKGGMDHH